MSKELGMNWDGGGGKGDHEVISADQPWLYAVTFVWQLARRSHVFKIKCQRLQAIKSQLVQSVI